MLNIISATISGLLVGVLARYFYPGAVEMGWIATILLGIGSSLLVGLITASRSRGGHSRGGLGEGFNRAGCLASVLGAMALIFIGRALGVG